MIYPYLHYKSIINTTYEASSSNFTIIDKHLFRIKRLYRCCKATKI